MLSLASAEHAVFYFEQAISPDFVFQKRSQTKFFNSNELFAADVFDQLQHHAVCHFLLIT